MECLGNRLENSSYNLYEVFMAQCCCGSGQKNYVDETGSDARNRGYAIREMADPQCIGHQ